MPSYILLDPDGSRLLVEPDSSLLLELDVILHKFTAQGTIFEVNSLNTPGTWIAVNGIRRINELRNGVAEAVEITDVRSPAKEYAVFMPDSGHVEIELFYDPTDPGQVILEDMQAGRLYNTFRVRVLPEASFPVTFNFGGYVQKFGITFTADEAVDGDVRIRTTGHLTRT